MTRCNYSLRKERQMSHTTQHTQYQRYNFKRLSFALFCLLLVCINLKFKGTGYFSNLPVFNYYYFNLGARCKLYINICLHLAPTFSTNKYILNRILLKVYAVAAFYFCNRSFLPIVFYTFVQRYNYLIHNIYGNINHRSIAERRS